MTINTVQKEKNIEIKVRPKINLATIADGEEFNVIRSCLDVMRNNKNNKNALHEASKELARTLDNCFGMKTTIAIVSFVDGMGFYGYNVFPSMRTGHEIINSLNNLDFKNIRAIWQQSAWHIDIDARMLYDISNKLTSAEMATLLLYCIEQVVFDYDTPIRIAYTIAKFEMDMKEIDKYIARSSRINDIFMIPFMLGCSYSTFILNDKKNLEHLHANSIIAATDKSFARYISAVKKIYFTYGAAEIVDQSQFMIDKKIIAILNWIYEGLNDLRHSALRLIENIQRFMVACRSPYVRLLFKNMMLHFNSTAPVQGTHQRGINPVGDTFVSYTSEDYVNPELQALRDKQKNDYWKEYIASCESKFMGEFIDNRGYIKKVTTEEIDMIRVEAEGIESIDDKVYLLEKLYKHIATIDAALDMIESGNAKKVKQTKNQLLAIKAYAQETRAYIMKYKIQPSRYGLYIKYPAGYEG